MFFVCRFHLLSEEAGFSLDCYAPCLEALCLVSRGCRGRNAAGEREREGGGGGRGALPASCPLSSVRKRKPIVSEQRESLTPIGIESIALSLPLSPSLPLSDETMLLRTLLAQTRRAVVAPDAFFSAEKLLPLSRAALSTGARAERASSSSPSESSSSSPSESSTSPSDLEDFRAMLSDFAGREIAPLAEDIDRKNTAPMDLWTKMGDFGLHGTGMRRERERERFFSRSPR